MSMDGASRWLDRSDRVYRVLLRAYPASFRRGYGTHMALAFRDSCRAALQRSGPAGLVEVWVRTVFDWIRSATEQHIWEAFNIPERKWVIRLGSLAAILGGALGLILVMNGPNSYGNYGWDGWMASIVALLLAAGMTGGIAELRDRLTHAGLWGMYTIVAGLVLMGLGLAFEPFWGFIFIGPMMLAPVGAALMSSSLFRVRTLPVWWRWFAVALPAIAILGFAIELAEEFAGNSTPDRGVQLAEAMLSIVWIALGIGLWLTNRDTPDNPKRAAWWFPSSR